MTLIKSISGIRGTIGGKAGSSLSPIDIVKFTSAFAKWLKEANSGKKKVVIGRDARLSGTMVQQLVSGSLIGMGMDVIDAGLSTTPTVEMAVPFHKAAGGIIITASHNPKEWNALKLLNHKGEFISDADGKTILEYADSLDIDFAEVNDLGKRSTDTEALKRHIEAILALEQVDAASIQKRDFKIVVDGVNSSGGFAVPELLEALGVRKIETIFCEPTGLFPHNPEPLPEHLEAIVERVLMEQADLGIVVDPDVDRLAFVCEDGSLFGEEYTLVAVADYLLSIRAGNTVSNLSSSRALRDITEKQGATYYGSAVGEVNVVRKMKETQAVIGGEGNGGVIFPKLHYGRDALVGIALVLSHLAKSGTSLKELKTTYPAYFMAKKKIQLTPEISVDTILARFASHYQQEKVTTLDGVKVDFEEHWIHLRKSNTEPIIRIYTEAKLQHLADQVAKETIDLIQSWF